MPQWCTGRAIRSTWRAGSWRGLWGFVTVARGLNVAAVAVGDMNRDGYAEVALAHSWAAHPDRGLSVVRGAASNPDVPYLQTAASSRVMRVTSGAAGAPTRMAMGDVTGDGRSTCCSAFLGRNRRCRCGSRQRVRHQVALDALGDHLGALDSRWTRVDGDAAHALAGSGIGVGDVTGNRIADLVVGAEGATNWATVDRGRVAMFAGTRPSDLTAPSVATPTATLASSGSVHPLVPLRIGWSASDTRTGVVAYDVQRQVDGGRWASIGSVGVYQPPPARMPRVTTIASVSEPATAPATGRAGGTAPRSGLTGRGDSSSAITWRGTWALASSTEWWGGTARYARAAGKRATLSFTGRSVAWVAAKGPDRGRARVYIGGTLVQTIDLHASTLSPATIVFRRSWSSSASRTIRVEVVGTAAVLASMSTGSSSFAEASLAVGMPARVRVSLRIGRPREIGNLDPQRLPAGRRLSGTGAVSWGGRRASRQASARAVRGVLPSSRRTIGCM